MTKYELYIEADHNDGDYITEIHTVDTETIERFEPMFKALKDFDNGTRRPQSNNFEQGGRGDCSEYYIPIVGKELFEEFSEYVPCDEYGVHTITSINYYELPNKIKVI